MKAEDHLGFLQEIKMHHKSKPQQYIYDIQWICWYSSFWVFSANHSSTDCA
jgi:hypothetical protein